MDGHILQNIKNHLLERWQHLTLSAKSEVAAGKETDEPQAEIIDIAQTLEQLGRDASLKEQERRELAAVERALAKMSSGNFGRCEDCSEDIPPKRLAVLPEARLCAQCQTYEERQNSRVRSQA